MTDPRIDALAEALDAATYPDVRDGYGFDGDIKEFAAAILAALPPDWCGHGRAKDCDGLPFCPSGYAQRYHAIGECDCGKLARLRKIEEAARDRVKVQDWCRTLPEGGELVAAFALLDEADARLRAALEAGR